MSDVRDRLVGFWPTDALCLRTPRLELRPVIESEFAEIIEAIRAGIHDPATMPFGVPWTDAPADELPANTLRHLWENRAAVTAEAWTLQFGIRHADRLIGIQGLSATHFAVTRTVSTGSWLTQGAQGQGLGTEMRYAAVMFAIDHLGAEFAETSAFTDNAASNAVSRTVGYRENGTTVEQRRPAERAEHQRYLLTPDTLRRPDWTLQVTGLQGCRHLLV